MPEVRRLLSKFVSIRLVILRHAIMQEEQVPAEVVAMLVGWWSRQVGGMGAMLLRVGLPEFSLSTRSLVCTGDESLPSRAVSAFLGLGCLFIHKLGCPDIILILCSWCSVYIRSCVCNVQPFWYDSSLRISGFPTNFVGTLCIVLTSVIVYNVLCI